MFVGPVFTRELVTAPRRLRFYAARAVYAGGLLALVSTAWLLLTGAQEVRNIGDMARFGATLFQILAPLQLALAMFFATVLAASAVAQEKDRRTLVLLLMTNLSNSELVLGKLFSSLLQLFVLLAAGLPIFLLTMLFGGTSYQQVVWVYAVTLATALAAGSIGSMAALWREKTFQTLALVFLTLMAWLAIAEVVIAVGSGWGRRRKGQSGRLWGAGLSPWRAGADRGPARPDARRGAAVDRLAAAIVFGRGGSGGDRRQWAGDLARADLESVARDAALPSGRGCLFQRAGCWSPAFKRQCGRRQLSPVLQSDAGKSREVWDNPILWREVRTWAYGRKVLAIRVAYLLALGAVGSTPCGGPWLPTRRQHGSDVAVCAAGRVEPDAGQRSGRYVDHDRTRPRRARSVVSHRHDAAGIHLRQVVGRVLRDEGNHRIAAGALRLSLVVGSRNDV